MRATNNPKCPPGEPVVGCNSTCDTPVRDFSKPMTSGKKTKLPHYCNETKEGNIICRDWAQGTEN